MFYFYLFVDSVLCSNRLRYTNIDGYIWCCLLCCYSATVY